MNEELRRSYADCVARADKVPMKDRLTTIEKSTPIVRMQLIAHPQIGFYPHFSVIVNTGINFALISLHTNENWKVADQNATGWLYCHPTIETITNKPDNVLSKTLPVISSPKYSKELNERIILRLPLITFEMIYGKRCYHALKYNCQTFVNELIREEQHEVDNGQDSK